MSREASGVPFARCLLVWTTVTVACLALSRALVVPLREAGPSFESVLVGGCAAALVACLAWCWTTTTVVVAQALRGASPTPRPGVVRRAVLVACGVVSLAAAPATADPPGGSPVGGSGEAARVVNVLDGLPLPTRPTASHAPPERAGPERTGPEQPGAERVTVRPGDTLWAIAEESLAGEPSAAAIEARWRAVWAANRATVGPDPDVIHPGAVLRLPREES